MIHFKFVPISFIRTASIVKFHFPKHIFMNKGYRVEKAMDQIGNTNGREYSVEMHILCNILPECVSIEFPFLEKEISRWYLVYTFHTLRSV